MKHFFLLFAFTLLLSIAAFGFQLKSALTEDAQSPFETSKVSEKNKPTVLIELFTSEGCPTCPPADLLLEMLGKEQPNKNAEIVTLALHVDYWDRADWKDKYSSAIFSRRQDIYAQIFRMGDIYTPMMVVDGQNYFGGSKAEKAHKAIDKNAKNEKAEIGILIEQDKLKVEISNIPKHEPATVYLAIAEDELASNGRRSKDTKYYSVVRELKSLGLLTPQQNKFTAERFIQFQKDWKKENLNFVVFIQENQSRKVLGVQKIRL